MQGETVEQLARTFGIEAKRLIEQFSEVGFEFKPDSEVPEEAKMALLDLLNQEHTKELNAPGKKIALRRKSTTEIKVQRSSGRKGTVSVVSKRRRVFIKPEEQEEKEEVKEEAVETEADSAVEKTEKKETDKQEAAVVVDKDDAAKTAAKVTKKDERGGKKGRFDRGSDDGEKKKKPKAKVLDESEKWDKGKLMKAISSLNEEEGIEGDEATKTPQRAARARRNLQAVEAIQKKHTFEKPTGLIQREVKISEGMTVAELAQKMSVKNSDLIKRLMKLGVMATVNETLDPDTAGIVVEEMGHKPQLVKAISLEDSLHVDEQTEALPRAPVVTVMGHVDHGKTSLLDYIRTAKVAEKEAGGITQHIGAYHVTTSKGQITFLDTPGHAAFTAMRARGAQCTDLVVLVVAADDGIMPQTIEAIQHAKAAEVPIIVAINKIDKKDADLDRIQNELASYELVPEAWGGDVIVAPVSAKEGTGIDALLESISLQAEMLELKAPASGQASGVVLEARLDKGRGPVASLLVQRGTLRSGEVVLCGNEFGRVRAMTNELGKSVSTVGPSMPVEVLGLSGVPQAGESFMVLDNEKKAREVAMLRQEKHRHHKIHKHLATGIDDLFARKQESEDLKDLTVIVKADVRGSAEALTEALEELTTDKVKIKVISTGVGGINESDITLSMASNALLVGFNVRADSGARRLAEKEEIKIFYSGIIYEVIDMIKAAITGMLEPEMKERILGLAEVRDVFRSAKIGAIAGCKVIEGVVKRGLPIRVLRDNVVIYEGELESLRRFKEDVSEARNGMECGIGVKNYNDVKVGDQIEVYERVAVAPA